MLDSRKYLPLASKPADQQFLSTHRQAHTVDSLGPQRQEVKSIHWGGYI